MRLVNRVAALLLTLGLLVGGLLLVAEVVAVALNRPGLVADHTGWHRTLTTTRLRDPWVRTGIIAAGVLGLLILFGQLVRWKPDRLPTRLADGWHLQRRSVEQHLAGAADGVAGVASATAVVRRYGTGWRTRIRAVGEASVAPAVESAVRQELERLGASPDDPVAVDMIVPGPVRRTRIRLRR
ncbi:Asp23/Gls24 family envelope stress response protein [Plantactinospora sonchi]|uniref:Alkaline shock response membrane anchor protein AmaP n=1 Tax=Plantactinospora sonchi TaxID=1544735 RepID=A0ABU7S3F7_9ACTN